MVALLLAAGLASAEGLKLVAEPAHLVAGETRSVLLTARGGSGSLRLEVEVGTVEPPVAGEHGTVQARWHLPASLTPRRIVAGVVDEGSAAAAFATVAVSRRARFRVQGEPGTDVRVALDGEVLDSARVESNGVAHLTAVVPPATTLELGQPEVASSGDARIETRRLRRADQLRLWGMTSAAEAATGGTVSLFVLAHLDSGAEPANVEVTLDDGAARPMTSARPGVWTTVLTGDVAGVWRGVARASLTGFEPASFESSVRWSPAAAARLALTAPEQPWIAGERGELLATLVGGRGEAVEGAVLEPVFNGTGTRPVPGSVEMREIGGGRYSVTMVAPRRLGTLSLVVRAPAAGVESAHVTIPVVAGPPAQLGIELEPQSDGSVGITVRAADLHGNPSPAGRIVLSAGSGTLSGSTARGTDALRARWRPSDRRRSTHVDLVARVEAPALAAHGAFDYEAPRGGWRVGARGGVLVDLDRLRAPTASVGIGRGIGERTALALDLSVARAVRRQHVARSDFTGSVERGLWLVPVLGGGRWRLLLGERVTLDLGAATGVLLSHLQYTASRPEAVTQRTGVVGASWLIGASATIAAALAGVELLARLDLYDALTGSAGWEGRPRFLALQLGIGWGGEP